MILAEQIASLLNVRSSQVTAVIDLLDAGNTIPSTDELRQSLQATGNFPNDFQRSVSRAAGLMAGLSNPVDSIIRE